MFPSETAWQLTLMAAEILVVSGLLLGLIALRNVFGLAMLYLALGVLQHMQTLMAVAVYVEVAPGLMISPGSAVLFTATLFAVLVVYVEEGAFEVRRLLYGLIGANFALSLLMVLFGQHLESSGALNLYEMPPEFFDVNLRVFVVGTIVLFLDVFLIILLFDALGRWMPRSALLRVMLTMLIVVSFDSLLFTFGGFFGSPGFYDILVSNLVGKVASSLLYSIVVAAFLLRSRRRSAALDGTVAAGEVFGLLTYRQRFEHLREMADRDALTRCFNRGYFERHSVAFLDRRLGTGQSVVLALLDLDHFKSINDRYGHSVGDEVLRKVIDRIERQLRTDDLLCRYGGEEFVMLLPSSDPEHAEAVLERIRRLVEDSSVTEGWLPGGLPVTMTIGAMLIPPRAAGETVAKFLEQADRCLYEGKRRGRNRVIFRPVDEAVEESSAIQPV
ncbi:GGDEF domain-containing protein [Halomonas denitrificans]|nr:GGDEF domain-containing protein [Halomonas denitrificans]